MMIPPITAPASVPDIPDIPDVGSGSSSSGTAQSGQSFGSQLTNALTNLDAQQNQADQAANALASGQTSDIAGVALAMDKAQLSFDLAMEVRNKVLDAYTTINQMQV